MGGRGAEVRRLIAGARGISLAGRLSGPIMRAVENLIDIGLKFGNSVAVRVARHRRIRTHAGWPEKSSNGDDKCNRSCALAKGQPFLR